jgi:hypothetical protein
MDTNKKLEANTTAIAVIQNDMNYIKTQLDSLVRSMTALRLEYAAKNEVSELAKRVDKIEGWFTWIIRIILGAILVALLALVINKG